MKQNLTPRSGTENPYQHFSLNESHKMQPGRSLGKRDPKENDGADLKVMTCFRLSEKIGSLR